ncbi:hypothetical protein VTO73DRAFT_12003 [Trametes versicolor]
MNYTNNAELSKLEAQSLLNVEMNYCSAAALALLTWHYLLTFDKEIALFWKLPLTGANALFLANRYLTLAYAFYYAPWWPASTSYECCGSLTRSLTLVSRASLIVADAIVVMLTFAATHGQYRTQDVLHVYGRMETLTGVMCTNGAIYFLTLTIMNILYLGFYTALFASGELATNRLVFLASFVNTMYDTLTAILTTNFLIRLREVAHASTHISTPCDGMPDILQFAHGEVDSWLEEPQPLPIVEA